MAIAIFVSVSIEGGARAPGINAWVIIVSQAITVVIDFVTDFGSAWRQCAIGVITVARHSRVARWCLTCLSHRTVGPVPVSVRVQIKGLRICNIRVIRIEQTIAVVVLFVADLFLCGAQRRIVVVAVRAGLDPIRGIVIAEPVAILVTHTGDFGVLFGSPWMGVIVTVVAVASRICSLRRVVSAPAISIGIDGAPLRVLIDCRA